jgi:hypothetical protein
VVELPISKLRLVRIGDRVAAPAVPTGVGFLVAGVVADRKRDRHLRRVRENQNNNHSAQHENGDREKEFHASSSRIRAFRSLTLDNGRKMLSIAGDEWRQAPRETVVSRIESMASVVIEIDEATVDALRDGSGDRGFVRDGGRPA